MALNPLAASTTTSTAVFVRVVVVVQPQTPHQTNKRSMAFFLPLYVATTKKASLAPVPPSHPVYFQYKQKKKKRSRQLP